MGQKGNPLNVLEKVIVGYLWDTENGPSYGDEINLVKSGFNSGWVIIQGLWSPLNIYDPQTFLITPAGDRLSDIQSKLIDFNGKGKYSDPELIWNQTIGITALKFLDTDKLGKEYENDLFVGDINLGNIYHFDLNEDRTKLILKGELEDKIAETVHTERKTIRFAEHFTGITDLEVGPYDRDLYILSFRDGSVYKIVQK